MLAMLVPTRIIMWCMSFYLVGLNIGLKQLAFCSVVSIVMTVPGVLLMTDHYEYVYIEMSIAIVLIVVLSGILLTF